MVSSRYWSSHPCSHLWVWKKIDVDSAHHSHCSLINASIIMQSYRIDVWVLLEVILLTGSNGSGPSEAVPSQTGISHSVVKEDLHEQSLNEILTGNTISGKWFHSLSYHVAEMSPLYRMTVLGDQMLVPCYRPFVPLFLWAYHVLKLIDYNHCSGAHEMEGSLEIYPCIPEWSLSSDDVRNFQD